MVKFYLSIFITTLFLGLSFDLLGQAEETYFITTWKTDNQGVSADNQVTIPTNPNFASSYNYVVDWGDGVSTNETSTATHTYSEAGTYTIKITGTFPAIYFNNSGDRNKILSVSQWGDISWLTMEEAFFGCENLRVTATDAPDLSLVTSIKSIFEGNFSLNDNINHWDVSNVENAFRAFKNASSFNQPLNNWDVSSIIDMADMFAFAKDFNQPLDNWNTVSLLVPAYMFWDASSFNQDISSWNVSNVINMDAMFWNATNFDQDLSGWDIGSNNVFNLIFTNSGLSTRNYDLILNSWATKTSATNLNFGAGGLNFCNSATARQDLINTNSWVFDGDSQDCQSFITTWKTDNQGASANNQIQIPTAPGYTYNYTVQWGDGTSSTETGPAVHTYANSGVYTVRITGNFPSIYFNNMGDRLKLLAVNQWGDNAWSSLQYSFSGCENLKIPATDSPNLLNVSSIYGVFLNCINLNSPSISSWDVSNVQNLGEVFGGCSSFNQDLSNWNTSNAISMNRMFQFANNFNQDLSTWNIVNVENFFNFLDDTDMSSSNYDKLLDSWVSKTAKTGIVFGANGLEYCNGFDARKFIEGTQDWIFEGDIESCDAFVTTWKTDNIGTSEDNQITIPTNVNYTYNYTVDWGDNTTSIETGTATHTYSAPGVYTISISGDFPAIQFNDSGDKLKLLTIEQWGSINWQAFENAFWGCENLTMPATDVPVSSQVNSMWRTFLNCANLNSPSLSNWDVSNVSDFESTFQSCSSLNQDLSRWNVSNVYYMGLMFDGATNFDQDLSAWDISSANFADGMFDNSGLSKKNYDKILESWSLLPVTPDINFGALGVEYCLGAAGRNELVEYKGWTITGDVESCSPFITTWKTDNSGLSADNQITIPVDPAFTNYNYLVDWGDGTSTTETGSATHTYENAGTYTVSISGEFPAIQFANDGDKLKILSVEQWGDVQWESMYFSFYGCTNLVLNAIDVPNLEKATNLFGVFALCTNLNSPSISDWDVSTIEELGGAFFNCTIFNQDLSSWATGNVTSLGQIFTNATNFDQNLANWDVSNLNAGGLFNAFNNSGLSSKNYDKLLNSWALQNVNSNIDVGVDGLSFCDGALARDILISKNWNFIGDTRECLPFAQYIFDGNADDITNNGYNGDVEGAELASDRFSVPQNAYSFSQGEDRIVLQNTIGDLNISENFTVSAWVNPSSFDGESTIVANHDQNSGFGFLLSNVGSATFNELKVDLFGGSGINGGIVTANEWNHVVMAYSPSGGVKVYLNGVLTAENTNPINVDLSESTAPISIGNHNFHNVLNGIIDDVALYSNFLSEEDVLELYEQGNWPLAKTAQYDFSGNAVDVTGNGYDGLVDGAVLSADRFNQADNAYNFVNGSIKVDSVPVSQEMSIVSWFQSDADFSSGYKSIIDLRGSGALSIGANNFLEGVIRTGLEDYTVLSTDFPVNDGRWHLATMTLSEGVFKLYLDDSLVSENTNITQPLYSDSDSAAFNIGLTNIDNVFSFFPGNLDDVKFYDFAINEFQVEELFNEGGFVAKPLSGPKNPDLMAINNTAMRFKFDRAEEEVTGYIAVRSSIGFVDDSFLQDGTTYEEFEFFSSLDAYVIPVVADTIVNDFNVNFPLEAETEYFYKVWSFNGEGTNIKYGNAQTLSFSRSTLVNPANDLAKDLVISNVTETSMQIDFIGSEDPNVTGYLVTVAQIIDGAFPSSNGELFVTNPLNIGDFIGDFRIVANGTDLTTTINDLSPATRQLIDVYTITGTGSTAFHELSQRQYGRFTLVNEPTNSLQNLERSAVSTSAYTITFEDSNTENLVSELWFIEERENANFLSSVNYTGIESFYNQVEIGEFANDNSVEIRFGSGNSQKAHRFLVPDGATSGVADLNYQYQDYVDIPFEVWDIERNIQLNVSFRDQDRNGVFNLLNFNTDGAANEQSREYLFISDTEYNPSNPNVNLAVNGGQIHRLMYQNWWYLTDGLSWDENNLPEAVIRYAFYDWNERGYLVVKNGNTQPTDGSIYKVGDLIGEGTVVYKGSLTSFIEDNLTPETESNYSLYPYSGYGLLANYNQSGVLEGTLTTLAEEPTSQATDISYSDITASGFNISFAAASDSPDGYLVLRNLTGNSNDLPSDGESYSIGDPIGNSIVAFAGSETQFEQLDLEASTAYFYQVFSYNGNSFSSNYLTVDPLSASNSTLFAEPLSQPTDINFTERTSSSFTVSFNAVDNNYFTVLRTEGEILPDGIPIDGIQYNVNDQIGNAVVVHVGNQTSFVENQLQASTVYNYHIFASNGEGELVNYLTIDPLAGSNSTSFSEPLNQPTDVSFVDITSSSFTVNFNGSTDNSFIALRTEGENVPDTAPLDGVAYTIGDQLGNATVAYLGNQTSFVQDQLDASTVYNYQIFAANGDDVLINFLSIDPLEGSNSTLFAEPINQAANISFAEVSSSSFTVNFDGNENDFFIALRTTGEMIPDVIPVDATPYNVGDQIGNAVVAYLGSETSFIQDQLQHSTVYNYYVFAANGSGTLINYLQQDPLEGTATTFALEPTGELESLSFSDISESSVLINIASGSSDADAFIVFRYTEEENLGTPSDGQSYQVGEIIENAEVVYNGSDVEFTDAGLSANTLYRYEVFTYNGEQDSVNYQTDFSLIDSFNTLVSEPQTQPTSMSFTDITINSLVVNFDLASDNPESYLIVMREGTAAEALPVDGLSYQVGVFLDAGQMEEVIYIGNDNSATITDLTINTEYNFTVYSFNGENQLVNYNVNNPLQGTQSTLADITPPEISVLSYSSEVDVNGNAEVRVMVQDNESSISTVEIEYIKSNQGNYDNSTLEAMSLVTNGEYSFSIPNVGIEGMEFKILAENSMGLSAESESFPISVQFVNEGLTVPYNAFGTEQSNYRIVSVPLDLSNNTVNDIFGQQLGDYGDASKWRMFRYNGNATSELSGNTALDPGNGYWLIANATDVTFTTGAGTSVPSSLDSPFEIELQPGWNQIGNPYTFDVSWTTVLEYNNQELDLRIYDGNWRNSSTLSVFSGGFVFWPNDQSYSLKIPKGALSTSQNRKAEVQEEGFWMLPIELHGDEIVNSISGIGMAETALDAIDEYDQFNLPRFLEYIELSHQNELFDYTLSTDIVKLKQNHTWTFNLSSNGDNSSITMKWGDLKEIEYLFDKEIKLLDPKKLRLIDMKRMNSYTFNSKNVESVKIIVGNAEYVKDELDTENVHFYDPYPNPSSALFNISYFVPERLNGRSVEFEVIDIRGNKISGKYFSKVSSGLHHIKWDVHEQIENIASGLYIINMTVNNEIQLQKKIFIRN